MFANTDCSGDVQSEACFEAMQIDWPVIRQQAMHRGVIMTRVAVRDFDHNDQVCTDKTHITYRCCLARVAQCIMLHLADRARYAFALELSTADLLTLLVHCTSLTLP